jgi:hypothetical protein
MGWPDQAIGSARQYLEGAVNAQTDAIDQIIEGWKRQIDSTSAPMPIPRGFTEHMPGLGAKTEFNPLEPWMFWLQAAEMWQRSWMPDAPSRKDNRPPTQQWRA